MHRVVRRALPVFNPAITWRQGFSACYQLVKMHYQKVRIKRRA